MTADKQRAHALVDRVPADPMTAAVRFLEFLLLDPVNRALATAPVEDEVISEEEEQAVVRCKEWFQRVVFDSVRAKLLLESDVFWARASIGHIGHDQTSRSFRKRAIVELELP